MSEYVESKVLYFAEPGPQNTEATLRAVRDRLAESDIKHVVVASISGETASKVAEKLRNQELSIICVSGFAGWLTMRNIEHPFVRGKLRKKLESLGVSIVDRTPSTFSGDTIDYGLARYGYVPASWFVAETLEAVGGYGLKTAVEVVLMATDCGAIPPFTEVIAIAGTDRGADTAIIAKSTYSPCMFSGNSNRRFQILEIIALPRKKKWYKTIGVGGLTLQEIEKGEALSG